MSMRIAKLAAANPIKRNRSELLALVPQKVYDDGRTKQSFKDETDIQKIMARADKAGTISHLEKYQGVYADYSDFDFHTQLTRLAEGQTIFDELPAEIRQEFGQDAQLFFNYVNDPANVDKLREKLPALAAPGKQIQKTSPETADEEKAALAAATKLIMSAKEKTDALASENKKASEPSKEP